MLLSEIPFEGGQSGFTGIWLREPHDWERIKEDQSCVWIAKAIDRGVGYDGKPSEPC